MIRFRQKNFGWAGLINGGMLALTGGQMMQASSQAKEAKEQQEEMLAAQKRENAKLTKALNNIANQAKNNPQAALQAGHMVGQSKMFAAPAIISKGSQVVKDVIRAAGGTGKIGKKILGLGTAGIATGGAMYAVNKAQTADARKIGMIPKKEELQQRAYVAPSIISKAGIYAKKAGKYLASKDNLKQAAGWAAIGAAFPAVGYISERAQFKGQQAQQAQAQQRSYAFNAASVMKAAKGYARHLNPKTWQITKTPGQTTTGFIARMGSMGMIGRKGIEKFGKNLVTDPKAGAMSKKIGNWIINNPNKANLALGIGAGSVLTGAYGVGEKMTNKATKAVDKDAYAYENFKNQQIQQ